MSKLFFNVSLLGKKDRRHNKMSLSLSDILIKTIEKYLYSIDQIFLIFDQFIYFLWCRCELFLYSIHFRSTVFAKLSYFHLRCLKLFLLTSTTLMLYLVFRRSFIYMCVYVLFVLPNVFILLFVEWKDFKFLFSLFFKFYKYLCKDIN